MKNLNDFLEKIEVPGSTVSSDEFKLLPQQALDLLNRHRLPDPLYFMSLFLQSAFELGVDEVHAKSTNKLLYIAASGSGHERLSPRAIVDLVETPITGLISPENRLAVALQLARSMNPERLHLVWDNGLERQVLSLSDVELEVVVEESSGRSELALTFEPERKMDDLVRRASNQFGTFEFAPRPVRLNGTQINGHDKTKFNLAQAFYPARSATDPHTFIKLARPGPDNPVVGSWGTLIWFAREPVAEVEVKRVQTAIPFQRYSGPLPLLDRYINLRDDINFGLVSFVFHGEIVVQLLLKDVAGVEVISHCRGLNWDLSGLGIRDDEALLETLNEIYADCRAFLAVCRENLAILGSRAPSSVRTQAKAAAGGVGGATLGAAVFIGAILAGISLPVQPFVLGGLGVGGWLSSRKDRGRDKERKREDIAAFLDTLDSRFETLEKELAEISLD